MSTFRFVVKLTDFGLHKLRAESRNIPKNSHQYFRSKLWTAPEVLRSDPELLQFYTNPSHPVFVSSDSGGTDVSVMTTKADVYSFAIILHEILVRDGVWGSMLGADVSEQAS